MTEEQTGDEQVVDWAAALENAGGDESLLRELIGPFVEEAKKHLADMHLALERQDYVLMNRAAHTLKGSLRIVGALSATPLAKQLEFHFKSLADDHKLIKDGKKDPSAISPARIAETFEEAPQMVQELEPQVNRVIVALEARAER